MTPLLKRCAACLIVLSLLFVDVRPAHADELKTDAIEVVVAIVLVSVAITVGVILLVKKSPTATGCASDGPDGLQLATEDNRTYNLMGDTAGIHAGDRVHVKGKKRKENGKTIFIVEHTPKMLGSCPVAPAH